MKLLIWPVILLATSAPVRAQTSDDVALCKSSDTGFEIRLAACNAVIAGGEFDGEPWPFERRGDTYSDNDLYAESIADFDRSLEIDPNYPQGLRSRASAYGDLENYESALIDTLRLVEVEPDSYWNFYYHGVVLRSWSVTKKRSRRLTNPSVWTTIISGRGGAAVLCSPILTI